MIQYASHLALKKKKADEPQRYTITLEGVEIDEVALINLRGKPLRIVVDGADVKPVREQVLEEIRNRLENITEFISREG